jgi:hypothetical protein
MKNVEKNIRNIAKVFVLLSSCQIRKFSRHLQGAKHRHLSVKYLLAFSYFVFSSAFAFSQMATHRLYSLAITKTVNDQNKRIDTYIRIDSSGNVYKSGDVIDGKVDIQKLGNEISKWIVREKIEKTVGNNDVYFLEVPTPKLDQQHITVSVIFLEDFDKERDFRNKTSFDWSEQLDKKISNYPFYRYLKAAEIKLLKVLMK